MLRTSIASLLGAAVALGVAWDRGGVVGGGILAGFFLGAGITGLGLMYQRHTLLYRPTQAFAALGVSMMAKMSLLLGGALAFRYVEAAAARADWRAFLLSFAAAVAILLPFGVWDLHRTSTRARKKSDRSTDQNAAPERGPLDRATTQAVLPEAPCGSS